MSTAVKSSSGSPTLMPPGFRVSSRMVRSCCPVRFLTTERAWRMAPRASKYRSRITLSARKLTSIGVDLSEPRMPCSVRVSSVTTRRRFR